MTTRPQLALFAVALAAVDCHKSGMTSSTSTMTFADRANGLVSMSGKLVAFRQSGMTKGDQHKALADYIATLPGIEESGVSADDSVWGRFNDGLIAIVADNRDVSNDPPPARDAEETQARVPATTLGMPYFSKQVRLLNMIGNDSGGAKTVAKLSALFSRKGYAPIIVAGNDVASLRTTVNGDAFFYINTHGGTGRRKGVPPGQPGGDIPSLFTSDPVVDGNGNHVTTNNTHGTISNAPNNSDNAPGIMPDLTSDPPRLVYMFAEFYDTNGNYVEEWHYGITPAFVAKYMTLTKDAMIFLNACNTFGDISHPELSSTAWLETFYGLGAGAFLGWSGFACFDGAFSAPTYLVDRMLGTNDTSIAHQTPDQRPFDLPSAFAQMPSSVPKSVSCPQGALGIDTRTTGLLAPSISYVEVDEAKVLLTLHGLFGNDPGADGQISVGGTNCPASSWQPDKIVCTIGFADQGDVYVRVNGIKSNVVPLTSWNVVFNYEDDWDTTTSLKSDISLFIHLRADLHRYRTAPDKDAPKRQPQNVLAAQDSTCTYNNSGSAQSSSGATITYSGDGTLPIIVSGTLPASYCVLEGIVDSDAATPKMQLAPFAYAKNGVTATVSGSPPSTFDLFTQTFLLSGIVGQSSHGLSEFQLGLDGSYGILPPGTPPTYTLSVAKLTLNWQAAAASDPPDDSTAQ